MNTQIAPALNKDGIIIFNETELRRYWETNLPVNLEPDETIRIVSQVKELDGSYGKFGILTQKQRFGSADDVMNFLNDLQKRNYPKDVGISVSTAVFHFNAEEPQTPKIESFKYSKTIALDIDTHIDGTKNRFPLGELEDDQIMYSIMNTWLEVSKKFNEFGIGTIIPKETLLTGGGLQFILEFERPLGKAEAQRIYGLMKSAIGELKWKTVLRNTLGNYAPVDYDIDKSFADIAHVQRAGGSINQKYGIFARFIDVLQEDSTGITNLRLRLQSGIENTGYTDNQKKSYKDQIEIHFKEYNKLLIEGANKINVSENLVTAKMQSARHFIKPSELRNVENDLLRKIKEAGINVLDLVRGDINLGPISGNLTKLYCPFHQESNPSMAFYCNDLFDVFKDFHDDTTYSFITFWEKLYGVAKSDAISQISEKAGVSLSKGERKEFQNLELTEIVDELLSRVDQETFVYYRLASKNRVCIARNIDTGEPYVFDGPKMLATHILTNQLNVCDAEEHLVQEFAKRFQERILVDAFEEFAPGKPTIFNKEFIKFVNLWVPSKRYKDIHSRAEEIEKQAKDPFNLDETLDLLKRKTPWSYKYLLQVVQNGDMKWFVNWLVANARFETVPTVPVVFGVQGAGKNLFVTAVMDYYLNNEYVKIVSGDRMMQQFNSILETTSLLVLDEGDFSNGKEIDQLKLLTGNDKILIEKKGVDASNKTRHFNILFFSNGEVPVRHPAMDRRITYFNNEVPLLASAGVWKTSIDDMIDRVREEMNEFWAIIVRTELDHKMVMTNCKNGQFWKQVLMQHPFGALIVKLMNGEWQDIALQLNENVQDKTEMGINLTLLETIKEQFESSGKISLTLVNRYIHSLNYRMKQSIQKFIQMNHLHEFGISTTIEDEEVKIVVNKKKVHDSLKVKNVLKTAYPKVGKQFVSPLEAELGQDVVDVSVEVEDANEQQQLLEEIKAHQAKQAQEFQDNQSPPPPPSNYGS